MIRSVPANGADNVYCLLLGQNSVHGVMAGYSGFSVALVNNKVVYIPIDQLVNYFIPVLDGALLTLMYASPLKNRFS